MREWNELIDERSEIKLMNGIRRATGSTHFNNKFHCIQFIIAARGPHVSLHSFSFLRSWR